MAVMVRTADRFGRFTRKKLSAGGSAMRDTLGWPEMYHSEGDAVRSPGWKGNQLLKLGPQETVLAKAVGGSCASIFPEGLPSGRGLLVLTNERLYVIQTAFVRMKHRMTVPQATVVLGRWSNQTPTVLSYVLGPMPLGVLALTMAERRRSSAWSDRWLVDVEIKPAPKKKGLPRSWKFIWPSYQSGSLKRTVGFDKLLGQYVVAPLWVLEEDAEADYLGQELVRLLERY